MKRFGLSVNRTQIMMANIAFASITLKLNSFVPRYVILPSIIGDSLEIPETAFSVQSLRSFLENLTLYVVSFTVTFTAWDRFYAYSKGFENPFDKLSTKLILGDYMGSSYNHIKSLLCY